MKEYPETHSKGSILIENIGYHLTSPLDATHIVEGDIGICIGKDGRVWICINGVSFLRFKPKVSENEMKGATKWER